MDGGNHLVRVAPSRVLVVDDDADVRDVLVRLLARLGYEACAVASYRCAFDLLQRERGAFAGMLVDLIPPLPNSLALVRLLRERHSELPLVLMTNLGSSGSRLYPASLPAAAVLHKPFGLKELQAVTARAFRQPPALRSPATSA
jgi:DNA-binding response OmpR family regulator